MHIPSLDKEGKKGCSNTRTNMTTVYNKKSISILYTALICFILFSGCMRTLERRWTRDAMENSGPVPVYSQSSCWIAWPGKHNPSDSIPAFLASEVRDTLADVFFIHPTSYTSDIREASWNADITDGEINAKTDSRSILYQASVFNGSCRIFAPRYRQAHLKAFILKKSDQAKEALELAYSDVRRAFQYYLDHENHGRPIIIASHSQGSHHAVRLLQEFFDGTPLQNQLVCAYVIGWPFDKTNFRHLQPGESAETTGCYVAWCTFQSGEEPSFFKIESGTPVCVNPLTWTLTSEKASRDLHQGAIFHDFNVLYPHILTARIDPDAHVLWVTLPEQHTEKLNHLKNLHILDYNLFWMNIRENVKVRIQAFLQRQHH